MQKLSIIDVWNKAEILDTGNTELRLTHIFLLLAEI